MNGEILSFRDLFAWQKAMGLVRKAYILSRGFPREETYGLTSQLRRSAISIPANIAEGQKRNHRKEFIQFLGIAKGSLAELQTFLLLAEQLGYAKGKQIEEIIIDAEEVERILAGLLSSLITHH
jgi:four helix bundle protein